MDINSRLFAAAQLDITINCLDCDGFAVFAGCIDGSLRVWVMGDGVFREVQRFMGAHEKSVAAISLDRLSRVLVTGGEE